MREMKDSGVKWIGEIPGDWNVFRNKNAFICKKEIIGKKSYETQLLSLTTKGIKKKDINNAEGKLPETFDTYQIVYNNNIVMCLFDLDVSAVFSGISIYDGMISPAYKILTCKKCVNPQYADYWFQYIGHGRKFTHYAKNIRFTLNIDEFMGLPMLFPTIEEQRLIVDYLNKKCSMINMIIEKQEQIVEKIKIYKQNVISEVVRGNRYDCKLTQSSYFWIGSIPSHWKTGQLKFFASIRSGITLGKKYESLDKLIEMPYLRVANVQGEYVDLGNIATISVLPEEVEKYSLHAGELLMTEGGDRDKLGRGCVWNGEIEPCLHQNHVFAVSTDSEKLDVHYLDYVTTSDIARTYFDYTAKKTTNLASTNSTAIMQFRIPVPPISEQREIVAQLDILCEKLNHSISRREKIINKLNDYKKSLIYEYVTGKKEVPVHPDDFSNTGIKPAVLGQIRNHAKSWGIHKVILFGSRARGTFHRDSDIDLAVSGGNIDFFRLAVEEETDTLLAYDVVNLDRTSNEELLDVIRKEGVIIYEEV